MADSKIEWTDRSDWNPIRGCTRASPGCGGPGDYGGCYAEAIAGRFSDPGQAFHGFAVRTQKGGRWTGKVAIQWDRLDLPLRWRKPAKVFASSTSDFFHEALDRCDIAQLFGVMIASHHLRGHTFQVLTKRADRMRQLLNDPEFWEIANAEAGMHVMERVDPLDRRSDDARATLDDYGPDNPPPGIWLGVSAEDQTRANERISDILHTPAAVRFVSCEPLLGPVDLTWIEFPNERRGNECYDALDLHRTDGDTLPADYCAALLDWVIVGGESGPGARPMHPDWARSLRDQCQAAGVPFFFKQWGEWLPAVSEDTGDGSVMWPEDGRDCEQDFSDWGVHPVRNLPGQEMWRVGKKRAGRLLDGREWSEFPAEGGHCHGV